MKKRLLYWSLPVFIMALIFFFSAQPSDVSAQTSQTFGKELLSLLDSIFEFSMPTEAEIDAFLRKIAHFVIYAALGGSFYVALRQTSRRYFGIRALLFSLLYAVSDEVHQYFVPGRSAQVSDVLLDFVGSIFGVWVIYLLFRHIIKKHD